MSKEESICTYKNQSQPIRVCTRWLNNGLKLNYLFIGTRGQEIKLLLQKKELDIELSAKEQEQCKSVIPKNIWELKNVRFIHRTIFLDDTRLQVLYKIARFIQEFYSTRTAEFPKNEYEEILSASFLTRKDLPIAWSHRQNWLFNVDKSWESWKSNPWSYDSTTVKGFASLFDKISKTPTHEYIGDELALEAPINFSYIEDCKWLQQYTNLINWYTLWNDQTELPAWEQLNLEEGRLSEIWNHSRISPLASIVQMESCFLQEYHESGVYSTKKTFMEMFDEMPITENLPFVQWVGDKYHVLYRVFKQHSLDESTFQSLTDVSKLSTFTGSRLTCMVQVKETPIFMKFIMEDSGHYYIHVKLGSHPIQIHHIHNAISELKLRMKKYFKMRLTHDESDVRAKMMLKYVPNISTRDFFQELATYGWLYSIKETEQKQQRIKLMYLRSMTSHQRVRPDEFIRTQFMFMDKDEDLITLLEDTFGLTTTKASEWLQQYRTSGVTNELLNPEKFKYWLQVPSFITLTRNGQNIQVVCERFANMEDIYRMIHWLQGTLIDIGLKYQAQSKSQVEPRMKVIEPEKKKVQAPVVEKKQIVLPKEISLSSSPESSIERDLSSSSSSSESSASRRTASSSIGGGYDLNEELKQADPTLFKDTQLPNNPSRYPRLCSANTNQQPVVVSQDEMKRIDESEFKEAYDNKILYGSDKDLKKHKYYFCPRIWCPVSKIPMTYEMLHSDKYKGKCPGPHFEEPWTMYDVNYWGKDPKKTHYIGFHSKQGTNGLCLPCCKINGYKNQEENPLWKKCTSHVKREKGEEKEPPSGPTPKKPESIIPEPPPEGPKKRGRKAKGDKEDKEEYYLLHFDAPISAQRWGVLPESLHKVVSPHQSYTSCYTQLKSDIPCLVRKGIYHRKDSLMNALGYIMTQGKGGKREFIELLLKNITPLDFISFENGWWLRSLLDKEPILPQHNLKEVIEWKSWVKTYPAYVSTMKLSTLLETDLDEAKQLRLSRELAIYRSWKRFWLYMKSSESKEVLLLYDIMRCLGVHLIIWEKTGPEKVYLRCPLPTSSKDIYTTLYDSQLPYIMLMHENDHYEPIELKSRGADGITLLDDRDLLYRLQQLGHTCGEKSNTFLQKYTLLYTYPRTVFHISSEKSNPWSISHLIVRTAEYMITGFVTKAGIYVQWPNPIPMKYLPDMVSILQTASIVYMEDIPVPAKKLSLPTNEVLLYMKLIQSLDMKWNVSKVEEDSDTENQSILHTIMISEDSPSIIPTTTLSSVERTRADIQKDSYHWIQLQKIVGARLMKSYDRIIPPILGLEKSKQIHELEKVFQSIPHKTKIHVILEEIPYHTKEALYGWYLRIGASNKYPFYTSAIQNGRTSKEWMFSQSSLKGGSGELDVNQHYLAMVRKPSKVTHPPYLPHPSVKTIRTQVDIYPKASPSVSPIPVSKIEWGSLPSKWISMKKYDWKEYHVCSASSSSIDFHNIWEWLSKEYKVPISKDLFKLAHQWKIASIIENEDIDMLSLYLQDPSVWRGLAKELKMTQSKSSTVIKHYLKLSKEEQWNTWIRYATSKEVHPTDLDIWLFANLTNSVVMMMHRSPSGIGVDTSERNKFQDFISSATVYHGDFPKKELRDRPFMILYKTSKIDSEFTEYDWVVYKKEHFYFKKLKDAPSLLVQLVEAVIKAQKDAVLFS